MQDLIRRWEKFWFGPRNLLGLAFMRITLCGTMLYMYVIRLFNLRYFSENNWITQENSWAAMPELYRPPFLWTFWPDAWAPFLHVCLVIFLALLTVGVGGRLLMGLTWILAMGFFQRNYSVNFGADVICALFMFYMMFTASCERLSVLNLWRRKPRPNRTSDFISSMMIRMMQFQICVVYGYTGWEKLKGGSWWDGTALWSVMANPQMTNFDFSFLRYTPWVIPVVAYLTIIFEVYFPVMVAWPKTRYLWLIIGAIFHAGIGIFMGLGPFATAMMSTYFLFIDPLVLEQRILQPLRKSGAKPSQVGTV